MQILALVKVRCVPERYMTISIQERLDSTFRTRFSLKDVDISTERNSFLLFRWLIRSKLQDRHLKKYQEASSSSVLVQTPREFMDWRSVSPDQKLISMLELI